MAMPLLLDPQSYSGSSVTVLIGANGSGKSRLLRELCVTSLRRGQNVVAVSPSPYDRFRGIRNGNFHFFGSRLGHSAVKKILHSVILRAASGDLKVLANFTRALEYTGFDAAIGVRVPQPSDESYNKGSQSEDPATRELVRALRSWGERGNEEGIVSLRLQSYSFTELHALNIAFIVRHAEMFRRIGVGGALEYFFFRDGHAIPFLEACSGEIAFVTAFAYISAHITAGTIIAIDEPETSLHPTWQKGYVQTLLDLFSLYEPKVFISTHSPIVISGAESTEKNITVLEARREDLRPFQHHKLSLEEMYDRLFGLITPKNHHLSNRAVSLFNDLNAGVRSLDNVLAELEGLKKRSYDNLQREAISKLEELARKMKQGG